MGYDALNRVLTRTYSDGTPTVTFSYDQSNCLALSACQNIGHRTGATDEAGSENWAFQIDKANSRSIHQEQRTTGSITKSTTYILDLAGNSTQVTYPTSRIVNFTFDAANRPSKAVDASNGISYATGPQTSPGTSCLANVTCYTPQGSIYAVSIGQTSTFTGLNVSNIYNSRLQPQEFKATSTGGNAIDISYSFLDLLNGNKNAGHVFSIANNLNSARTQSFTYDQLNRLMSAGTSSTTGAYCWGYQYSYDAWANLTSQPGWTSIYSACQQAILPGSPADANNHVTTFGYDPSGNTKADGYNSYTWDAESQLKTASGVTYTYDGDGRRISKVGNKLYWYDGANEILAETDATGRTINEFVFFGGKRIALLPASSTAQFYVEDFLGSSRIVTTNTGVVCYDADFGPYGVERPVIDSCLQNNYKFEGKERDSETGNDDFGARYYSWRFGRWLSADWSAAPAPVPYANLTNPQTLNLYAMVVDDPESFADLDGHQEADPEEEREGEAREDAEFVETLNRALAARPKIQTEADAIAREQFLAAHPEGFDDPLTGDCYAPKPGYRPGTKGDANHQGTVNEEGEKMGPGGETEVRVDTPEGKKGHRKIDAAKKDSNGKIIDAVQVIRPNKNGTVPKREMDAADDVEKVIGFRPRFVPVRPIIPKPNPEPLPPPPDLDLGIR